MLKRKPKILTPEQAEEIRTKDFFDVILPGTIKFLSDHYIIGDSYRCVWAVREYPPSTEEQAILSQLADHNGVAVAILTDKKLRRIVLGIILGVIIIIIMPVAAVISLFSGDIEIDTDRLQTLVVENLSAEEKAKLQAVEDTMYAIETAMTEKGFTAEKAKEAQVLYVLALSDHASQADFVSKLVGCFAEEQADEQLIAAVNTAFGTTLNAEDFTKPSPCAPVSSANIACSVRMNRQTSAYGVNLLRMLLDMNLITEGEYEKITRISAEYYDTEVVCV